MFPAHAAGIAVRFVKLPGGNYLRVVEAGPDSGPAVVMLHGWAASAYSFRHALPALAAAGCRAIAIDLPGHGLSDKPLDPAWYTRDAMTLAVESILEAVEVGGATVVGHSMGGALALELAITQSPRVRRVALINPVGLAPVAFVRLARTSALRVVAHGPVPRRLVKWLLRRAYSDPSLFTDQDVDEYWAPSQFAGFGEAMVNCLHAFSWDPVSQERLGTIRCPVLLVLATRDHLIHHAERGARAIDDVVVTRVPGGHAVNEESPLAVNSALITFARE
jgi:pimeloyl-ACP methyl ester carboxylesterase